MVVDEYLSSDHTQSSSFEYSSTIRKWLRLPTRHKAILVPVAAKRKKKSESEDEDKDEKEILDGDRCSRP